MRRGQLGPERRSRDWIVRGRRFCLISRLDFRDGLVRLCGRRRGLLSRSRRCLFLLRRPLFVDVRSTLYFDALADRVVRGRRLGHRHGRRLRGGRHDLLFRHLRLFRDRVDRLPGRRVASLGLGIRNGNWRRRLRLCLLGRRFALGRDGGLLNREDRHPAPVGEREAPDAGVIPPARVSARRRRERRRRQPKRGRRLGQAFPEILRGAFALHGHVPATAVPPPRPRQRLRRRVVSFAAPDHPWRVKRPVGTVGCDRRRRPVSR